MASFQNMESHNKLIEKRIIHEPLSHIPSNTVTIRDVGEQVMTFPMFIDDDDKTAQEPEEVTFPEKEAGRSSIFEEPPQITRKLEENKRDECLPENKNEFEEESQEDHKEGRQYTEKEDIEESKGVNPLTHKTNFVLVDNSLCMKESWKQPKENDEERIVSNSNPHIEDNNLNS
ncbi:hypothetical protein M9H77_03129 [Catharanthus roseus]|uniref:Uncharacterized protein n=1 Tax=Catharanthus roseus TaxID=4058 RepID=A0ACC0CAE8_CATRO|nr:hypothetical protein M9H77_03129 [Catharanthus roseus]